MQMPEELLHFIWRFRLFDQSNLRTLGNDELTIKQVGQHNIDAGPDFLMAKIRIAQHDWIGHVEIHRTAIDWYGHSHHYDTAYNNVILHVVWYGTKEVNRRDGTPIPTLCLANYVDSNLLNHYRVLMNNEYWIACQNQLPSIDTTYVSQWLVRLTMERLETKFNIFQQQLNAHKQDFEKITFIILARAFGQRVNADSFQELAQHIPLNLVLKYKDDPVKREALFLGMAGYLVRQDYHDNPYVRQLIQEFDYLKKLHGLSSLEVHRWKRFRMRPYNFPEFRIAQLAALYAHNDFLIAKILEMETLENVRAFLSKIRLATFWETHFTLDKVSSPHVTNLGTGFIDSLTINGLVHVLFLYGKYFRQESYLYRAVSWLEEIKAESNAIVKGFGICGIRARRAAESQALLHLKREYCDKKNCLSCGIGIQILRINRE